MHIDLLLRMSLLPRSNPKNRHASTQVCEREGGIHTQWLE